MALTPQIQVGQARALALVTGPADEIQVTQARALAAINFPTPEMLVSQAQAMVAVNATKPMLVTQARVYVAARGRVANPRVRAWTFTLDGHDFYVLRLGDDSTLVFDNKTKQWTEWASETLEFWRVASGITWPGGAALAHQYGSNVVAGDDTWGLLWFLDPEQSYDDHPNELSAVQEVPFDRVVMGQYPVRGHNFIPCYSMFLSGDNYGLVATDFTPGVTLETSDDAGKTFDDMGTINVTVDIANQEYLWTSLGQMQAPGRLFKFTDNGIFVRIDYAEMNDNAG